MANEILEQYRREERRLQRKYPWFNLLYNYMIALLCFALVVCIAVDTIRSNAQKRADLIAENAIAAYQAQQEAEEQTRLATVMAEKQSAEELLKQDAKNLAKLFYGVRNFEKRYGYTDADFYTLARCVFNRVESKSYPDTVLNVLAQDDQWIAYSVENPVLGNYYQIALKIIQDYQYEEEKPIDNSFLWCEVGDDGIWLIDGFGNNYTRWNYGKGSVKVVKR